MVKFNVLLLEGEITNQPSFSGSIVQTVINVEGKTSFSQRKRLYEAVRRGDSETLAFGFNRGDGTCQESPLVLSQRPGSATVNILHALEHLGAQNAIVILREQGVKPAIIKGHSFLVRHKETGLDHRAVELTLPDLPGYNGILESALSQAVFEAERQMNR